MGLGSIHHKDCSPGAAHRFVCTQQPWSKGTPIYSQVRTFLLTEFPLSAVFQQFLLTEAKPPGSQKPALLYTRCRCVMTFCASLNLPLFFFFLPSFLFVKHLLCRHVAEAGLDKHS